jgi:hypothetical protein
MLKPQVGRPVWAVAVSALALSCGLLAPSAQAATFVDTVLSNVLGNVGLASFTTPDTPGLVMTVTETSTATMTGSNLFDYEGLWLGSDGTGGRYTFSFNQPISSISFSFIALTALAGGPAETLNTFVSSAPTLSVFSSPDSSATWASGTLTPVEEDSRGVLTFTATAALFNSIRFDHLQGAQLQGFVLERVDVNLAPVPEPQAAWLFGAGLLALLARWRINRPGQGQGVSA